MADTPTTSEAAPDATGAPETSTVTAVLEAPAAPAAKESPISEWLKKNDPDPVEKEPEPEAEAAPVVAEKKDTPEKKVEAAPESSAPAYSEADRQKAIRALSKVRVPDSTLRAMDEQAMIEWGLSLAKDHEAVDAKLAERSVELQRTAETKPGDAQSAKQGESSPPAPSATLTRIADRLAMGVGLEKSEAQSIVADLVREIDGPLRAEIAKDKTEAGFAREAARVLLFEFAKQGLASGEFSAEFGDSERYSKIEAEAKELLRTGRYNSMNPIEGVKAALNLAAWSLYGKPKIEAAREHDQRLQRAQQNGGVPPPARRAPARELTAEEQSRKTIREIERRAGLSSD